MMVASSTPLTAKSKGPVPSPMIWNPDQSCGRVICRASATDPSAMMEDSSSSQPASQADGAGGEAFGPVIDRAGHGVSACQLGEAQRHHQLADEDDGPGPGVGRAGHGETKVEQLKNAGEDGDVADACGEAGELADAAVQGLGIAELVHAA